MNKDENNKIETYKISDEKKIDDKDFVLGGINVTFGMGNIIAVSLIWQEQDETYKFMKKIMPDIKK